MKNRLKVLSFYLCVAVLSVGLGYELQKEFILQTVHAQAPNGAQYKYINTATTTLVRQNNGYLYTVSINGGTGGVVTLYDIASPGCTGTPASGKFATIATATAPVTLIYNISVLNGLCVQTAAATDVTVSFN